MKKIQCGREFSTLLAAAVLLFVFAAGVAAQTRRKKTPVKKPAATVTKPIAPKAVAPPPNRGAGENETENPNSGLEITVKPKDVVQAQTFDAPFLEKCPKQNPNTEKIICVGIGGGSDEATPEEIEDIHKTVSRIFYGKRFTMVKLQGMTLPNQQDEARSKGCDFFIQTKYKSPFLKGEGTSVWEKVAGLTITNLPRAVSGVKVATDTRILDNKGNQKTKSDSQRQSDGAKAEKATENMMAAVGEVVGKMNIFKKDKKFEMTFNAYRLDDISRPFFSIPGKSKIKKNSGGEEIANTLYNLMRESTEQMQLKFLNPATAAETIQDSDSKKKDKNKKEKN